MVDTSPGRHAASVGKPIAICAVGALALACLLLYAALFEPGMWMLLGTMGTLPAVLVWKRNRLTRRQLLGGALVLGGLVVGWLAFSDGYTVGNIASEQSPVVLEWVSTTTIERDGEQVRMLTFDRASGTHFVPLWKLLAGYVLSVAGVLVAFLPLPERLPVGEANR